MNDENLCKFRDNTPNYIHIDYTTDGVKNQGKFPIFFALVRRINVIFFGDFSQ